MSKRPTLEKRDIVRPVNTMFVSSTSKPEALRRRQTYHIEPVIIEAIKIINFESREKIQDIVNRLLKEAIGPELLERAYENIDNMK